MRALDYCTDRHAVDEDGLVPNRLRVGAQRFGQACKLPRQARRAALEVGDIGGRRLTGQPGSLAEGADFDRSVPRSSRLCS